MKAVRALRKRSARIDVFLAWAYLIVGAAFLFENVAPDQSVIAVILAIVVLVLTFLFFAYALLVGLRGLYQWVRRNRIPVIVIGILIAVWLLCAVIVSTTNCDGLGGMDAPPPNDADDGWYCVAVEPALLSGELILLVAGLAGFFWLMGSASSTRPTKPGNRN